MDLLSIGLIFGSVLLALIWSIIHFASITKIKIGKSNKIQREKRFLWFTQRS